MKICEPAYQPRLILTPTDDSCLDLVRATPASSRSNSPILDSSIGEEPPEQGSGISRFRDRK